MSKRDDLENQINDKNIESYRQEYSEICQFLRHYSNLRFAILTVFFAIIAGLALVSFKIDFSPQPKFLIPIAKIAGFLMTIIFWIFVERTITFAKHYEHRANELEKKLGYQTLTFKPKAFLRIISMSFAIRSLYAVIAIFWIYAIFI